MCLMQKKLLDINTRHRYKNTLDSSEGRWGGCIWQDLVAQSRIAEVMKHEVRLNKLFMSQS